VLAGSVTVDALAVAARFRARYWRMYSRLCSRDLIRSVSPKLYRLIRMADAQNPASALAKMRWGSTVVDRAVETIAGRSDELTDAQRVRLRELADEPKEAS
jgi:hypothetical protein